ncbi:hypothetical protein EV363DRAFT_306938 [Boletus edulis]|nr:hypothetical protein EV363DRAFT_306938 [Boletus edulis]
MPLASTLFNEKVTLGYAYIRWFPNERRLQRMAVLGVIILDFLYTAVALEVTWEQLISCRRGISDACAEGNSWESFIGISMATLITYSVQMFYCYRVWIVSGKNRIITGLVATLAGIQLIFGAICSSIMIVTRALDALFTKPYIPALSVGASAMCDIIILGSMVFYLRESRTGVRRSGNRMHRMVVLFVLMGFLTCLFATLVVISYVSKGAFWEAAPGEMLPKLYVNSMLMALNARKITEEQDGPRPGPEILVPTIRVDTV